MSLRWAVLGAVEGAVALDPRICPKCVPEVPLRAREVSAPEVLGVVEIDVCERCDGMWLDWAELEQLAEVEARVPGASTNMRWQRDLLVGYCAACAQRPPLERVEVGAFGIDRCPACLGLWFDGGELAPSLSELQHGRLPRVLLPVLRVFY